MLEDFANIVRKNVKQRTTHVPVPQGHFAVDEKYENLFAIRRCADHCCHRSGRLCDYREAQKVRRLMNTHLAKLPTHP